MIVKLSQLVLDKIRRAKDGEAIVAMLIDLIKRENNRYRRGILHGYLLALTVQGIINNDDALGILDQIDSRID